MPRARDLLVKPTKRRPCTVTAIDGETTLAFDLVLLPATTLSAIEDCAREYAKSHGVAEPKPEDGKYLRGKYVHTLLAAAVDPEAVDKDVPYFDDVAQVERMLDDAWIVYACQEQADHQSEFAPSPGKLRPEDFTTLIGAVTRAWESGTDPERPFDGLRPRELRSFAATLVLRCSTLTALVSQRGLPTAGTSDGSASSNSSVPNSEKPS